MKMRTKFENKYFDLAENIHYDLDPETGIFHFESLDQKLYELLEKFGCEILENSTILQDKNRQLYYERIKKRAVQMGIDIFFIEDKPGQLQYSYEGDLIINPEIEENQLVGFEKFAVILDGKEFPFTKKAVEERQAILKKHKILLIQIINKYFPDYKSLLPQSTTKQKPELSINQIALKYAYEGLQITRENGNDIAKKYGHNSGEKLFQRFTYFSSSANRKGKPNLCTPKKLENKIKLIESVINTLPEDKQERAKDEVSILKKIYEAEYQ